MEQDPVLSRPSEDLQDDNASQNSDAKIVSDEDSDRQTQHQVKEEPKDDKPEVLLDKQLATDPSSSQAPTIIQGPKQKSYHEENVLSRGQKEKPEIPRTKKTSSRRDFVEKPPQEEKTQNQRQQIKEPIQKPKKNNSSPMKKSKKQESKNEKTQQGIDGIQTVGNNFQSDDEAQNTRYVDEELGLNQDAQQSAFIDDEQINNLTVQANQNQLNIGFIEKQVYLKYEHWVENKHLLVLYLLFRKQIYEQFPKKSYNRIDIHPSNQNKIKIFGTTNEEIKEISTKITELINKISIVKLNMRNEEAVRIKSSKLLNRKLYKDKMVIFRYGNNTEKSYYLGGKGSQPQLTAAFKQVRNLKFRYFRMFDYRNSRSYSIILGHFVRQREFIKAFLKWSLKSIEIVPFIPNFGHHGPKKDKEKSLCFLMTTVGNMENFSAKEIENNLVPFIKNNFYAIVLIFKQGEKSLPKLSVEGIFFKYVFQKKFSRAYVYILSLKKQFFAKRQKINQEIEKLAEKSVIYGVRYFDNISPERSEYIKPEVYREEKYPQNEPYSSSIIAKRIETEKRDLNGDQKKSETENMKEKEEKIWHEFDWKEHLSNLQPTEVSFIGEMKI